jgi:hypothetical protein
MIVFMGVLKNDGTAGEDYIVDDQRFSLLGKVSWIT